MTSREVDKSMEEQIVTTTCNMHCGGQCLLKVHVKDGVITRIETDDTEEPQYRACAKGRAMRQRVYAPDRLKWPMKRVGERGSGEFKRISWDEALDTIAGELKRVREKYGPAAIMYAAGGGDLGGRGVGAQQQAVRQAVGVEVAGVEVQRGVGLAAAGGPGQQHGAAGRGKQAA